MMLQKWAKSYSLTKRREVRQVSTYHSIFIICRTWEGKADCNRRCIQAFNYGIKTSH